MDVAKYPFVPLEKSTIFESSTFSSSSDNDAIDLKKNNGHVKLSKRQIIGQCLLMQAVYGNKALNNQNWTALKCSKLVKFSDIGANQPIRSYTIHSNFSEMNGGRGVRKKKRKSSVSLLPVESLGRINAAGYDKSVDEEWCEFTKKEYNVKPLRSWGKLPESFRVKWKAGLCDAHFSKARMAEYPVPHCDDEHKESKDLIAIMAATTTRNVLNPSPGRLSLFNMLFPSLMRSVDCGYRYMFVLGYDAGDPYYDTDLGMIEVKKWFIDNVENIMTENGIELTMVPVRVNNTLRKPGPVFLEMARRAFEMKADYLYRVNDDTELIVKWPSLFVNAIGSLSGRVGVVGPTCKQGNQQILTHDFVHRTHMEIFQMNYYPPELVDWWMDDWISFVYGESRSLKVSSVEVLHHTGAHGRRYVVDQTNSAKLAGLVKDGRLKIRNWLISSSADDETLKTFDNDKYQITGGTIPIKVWPQ